jgi:hypothetical protein
MSEPNYNELSILPFLEKKCKDLLSINLVLEAKLLAEMERTKWLKNKVDSLQAKIDSGKKTKKKTEDQSSESLDGETY